MTVNAPKPSASARPHVAGGQILFVDPSLPFLSKIQSDRKAALIPPLVAETGAKAIEILMDPGVELHALYVGQSVQSPDCLSVIRRARQLRPTLPVVLTYPGESCLIDRQILDKLGGCEAVSCNFTYEQVARQYFPPETLFEPADALAKASHDATPLGHEAEHDLGEFMPIRADSFLSGKKAYFDLYVKVGAKRLLKILKANDDFTRDRLDGYIKKGVEYFYIHKAAQQDYLAYSHKLTAAIVHHPSMQAEIKINHTLSEGEAVISFLRQKESVDPEQLRFAESYIRQVDALIESLGLEKQNALLAALLRNPEMREHAIAATILGGLIAHQLGFETKKSAAVVGIGCLLHDAGLPQGQETVENIAEEKMTDVQRRAWLEHPTKGYKIVSEIKGLSPGISDIVANHHRRRDGRGFPNNPGLGASKITVPAEIVGASEEIVRLFMAHMSTPPENLHREIRLNILPGFSTDLADAVKIVLNIGED